MVSPYPTQLKKLGLSVWSCTSSGSCSACGPDSTVCRVGSRIKARRARHTGKGTSARAASFWAAVSFG